MTESLRDRHAPVGSRLMLALPVLVLGAVLIAVALGVSGPVGPIVAVVIAAVTLGLVALALRTALVVEHDHLEVRNPFRSRRLEANELMEVRPERLMGLLGPLGTEVGLARLGGGVVRVVATLHVGPGDGGRSRAALFLALRRWCEAHGVADRLARFEYSRSETRLELLASDEEVEVQGRFRRTDARGWGSWTSGHLVLPGVGSGRHASWVADDPTDPASRGRPVQVAGAERVSTRGVRFGEEAFFGSDTGFVTISTVRRTVEVALRHDEAGLVLARLEKLDT